MKFLLGITLLVLSINLHAADSSKHEKLVELVNVMDMDAMIDSMYSQMELMLQDMSKKMDVKPSEQEVYDRYYRKMTRVMRESMSWEKMQPKTIEIYDRNFSEKEIADMLAFYKSDTGKAILAKMPVVMQESMLLGQSLMQETIPRIQEIAKELSEELKASRQTDKK